MIFQSLFLGLQFQIDLFDFFIQRIYQFVDLGLQFCRFPCVGIFRLFDLIFKRSDLIFQNIHFLLVLFVKFADLGLQRLFVMLVGKFDIFQTGVIISLLLFQIGHLFVKVFIRIIEFGNFRIESIAGRLDFTVKLGAEVFITVVNSQKILFQIRRGIIDLFGKIIFRFGDFFFDFRNFPVMLQLESGKFILGTQELQTGICDEIPESVIPIFRLFFQLGKFRFQLFNFLIGSCFFSFKTGIEIINGSVQNGNIPVMGSPDRCFNGTHLAAEFIHIHIVLVLCRFKFRFQKIMFFCQVINLILQGFVAVKEFCIEFLQFCFDFINGGIDSGNIRFVLCLKIGYRCFDPLNIRIVQIGQYLDLITFFIDIGLQFSNADFQISNFIVEIGLNRSNLIQNKGLIRGMTGNSIVELTLQIKDHLQKFCRFGIEIAIKFRPQTFQCGGNGGDKCFQINAVVAGCRSRNDHCCTTASGIAASGISGIRIPYNKISILDDSQLHIKGIFIRTHLINTCFESHIFFQ